MSLKTLLNNGDDSGLPVLYIIGTLDNVSVKDAEIYIRGLMERLCSSTERAGFRLKKVKDLIHFEIQEGGRGKSWLDWVTAQLATNPDSVIYFPIANRIVTVKDREGRLFGHLTSVEDVPSDILERVQPAEDGEDLTSFKTYAERWILTAGVLFAVSTILLLCMFIAKFSIVTNEQEQIRERALIKIKNMPMLHWPESIANDSYINMMVYEKGRWNTKYDQLKEEQGSETEGEGSETQPGEATGTPGAAAGPNTPSRNGAQPLPPAPGAQAAPFTPTSSPASGGSAPH